MMKISRSESGVFLGVCSGLENSLNIKARYWRILFVALSVFFSPWLILGLYLLAALVMPLPDRNGWNLRDNLKTLSRDAGIWSRREYREFREMVDRFKKDTVSSESKTV